MFQAVRGEIYQVVIQDEIGCVLRIASFCLKLAMSFHIDVSYPTDLIDIGAWCDT